MPLTEYTCTLNRVFHPLYQSTNQDRILKRLPTNGAPAPGGFPLRRPLQVKVGWIFLHHRGPNDLVCGEREGESVSRRKVSNPTETAH